ncbi:uncharacterized protein CLUP02_11445 [Colletotrichum lupini]|uniref:Uncharacterized protein n=1 Tax=Colletotrichum lupini TaxID=145971 RepID=A0A9Q8T0A8_9PEZI|nr:uncharacterized protein CLUP02_11445 [Colletotrichum lupini]UQC85946.1 hypothetical protein CLUP02_11445 [Colletotrichum lupini]
MDTETFSKCLKSSTLEFESILLRLILLGHSPQTLIFRHLTSSSTLQVALELPQLTSHLSSHCHPLRPHEAVSPMENSLNPPDEKGNSHSRLRVRSKAAAYGQAQMSEYEGTNKAPGFLSRHIPAATCSHHQSRTSVTPNVVASPKVVTRQGSRKVKCSSTRVASPLPLFVIRTSGDGGREEPHASITSGNCLSLIASPQFVLPLSLYCSPEILFFSSGALPPRWMSLAQNTSNGNPHNLAIQPNKLLRLRGSDFCDLSD